MTLIHQKEDIEMKKLLSLVLVLMLVLSAFALAESGSVTGEWYADFYGSVYTLTLNEDGTYVLNTGFEEDETGPWALDGDQLVIGSGDDSAAFAYDGESLTMALDEEVYMVFTREMPATFEPAAPVADATLDDFAGTWTAYKCGVNGMYFDQDGIVDLFGSDMTFIIEGDTMTTPALDEETPAEVNALTLEEGLVTIISNNGDEPEGWITYLEDDTIALSLNFPESELVLYLSRAE